MSDRKLVLPDSAHLQSDDAGRLCAPSATRNLAPIQEKLAPLVPAGGNVLELASGTGQQIVALAQAYPDTDWYPTDLDPDRLNSVRAWQRGYKGANLHAPARLDVAADWPPEYREFGLIYVVNLFHLISQQEAMRCLWSIAKALRQGGHAFIYGPFLNGDQYRSDGDAAFDKNLRAQDSQIGYKDYLWMLDQFQTSKLEPVAVHEMPANNLALVARL